MKKLTLLLLWIGLAGCLTGTGTSPAGITAPQDSPFAGAHSSGNSAPDVMGATSDNADAETGQCGEMPTIKKEYQGTSLRIPDCFTASVGPQAPNSQNPVSLPDPVPQWIDNRWSYSLTLMIQALYNKDGGEFNDHQDLIRGPIVRLISGDPVTSGDTSTIAWRSASYCDLPLNEVTADEGMVVTNFQVSSFVRKDTRVMAYLYYKPPLTASSALDFETTFPSGSPFASGAVVCGDLMRQFQSEEEFKQLTADIHFMEIGSYLIDIDESVQPTPDALDPNMLHLLPETAPAPETEPASNMSIIRRSLLPRRIP